MPALSDPQQIRAILETDRPWAVYALGDLEPPHAQYAEWFASPAGDALLLVYRAFAQPVLFTLGAPEVVRSLLAEATSLQEFYLLARPAHLPLLQDRYRVSHLQAMWRMLWAGWPQPPAPDLAVSRLREEDCDALEALYADGVATGEAPDFFNRAQVRAGVFYGLWEGAALVAAAGTHLVSTSFSLGAVGNVYVRRGRRGRGLGRRVTAAVTAALQAQGLTTLALNVNQTNQAALRVYTQLGYRPYCAFYEGVARR